MQRYYYHYLPYRQLVRTMDETEPTHNRLKNEEPETVG